MPSRTITIDDGAKKREQVALNLGAVPLNPAISSGGNYSVAVQATPKTNRAMQLAQSLRDGIDVAGKAVKLNQRRAAEDVLSLSDEEFNKVLSNGLDKEAKSLFGYTKAYNEALSQKYHSEVMPGKLAKISSNLFSDPYAYKTIEEFDAAAETAVAGAYEEADKILGGNVFGERANQALKSIASTDFLNQERERFIRHLPEVTRKTKYDSAFNTFNDITDFTQLAVNIEGQLTAANSALGNKNGGALVASAYLDAVETKIAQDDVEEAEAMIEAIGGEKGEYHREFNGVVLFNTKEAATRLDKLEDKLEMESELSAARLNRRAATATSVLSLMVQGLMEDAASIEKEDVMREELSKARADALDGSVVLGGVTYSNPIVLNSIVEKTRQMEASAQFFPVEMRNQFIATNSSENRHLLKEMLSESTLSAEHPEVALRFFKRDPLTQQVLSTREGSIFKAESIKERNALEAALYNRISGLPRGERPAEYRRLYPEDVLRSMQVWRDNYMSKLFPPKETPEKNEYWTDSDQEALDAIDDYSLETREDIIKETIEFRTAEDEAKAFVPGKEGGRQLRGDGKYSAMTVNEAYRRAAEKNLFADAGEQIEGFEQMRRVMTSPQGAGLHPSPMQNFYRLYTHKPLFSTLTPLKRAEKKLHMQQKFSRYGIDASELINDKANYGEPIHFSDIYGGIPDFKSFPIVINGGVSETLEVIRSNGSESPQREVFDRIARQYGIPVDSLIKAQEVYFKQNNFIRD